MVVYSGYGDFHPMFRLDPVNSANQCFSQFAE